MKKLQSLGKALTKAEQRLILGGYGINATCTVKCGCSADRILNATCPTNTTTCSATDGSGVSCNGTYYSCTYICRNY